MLDQDLKPDVPVSDNEVQGPQDVAGVSMYKALSQPSDRFIRVAEALHSASKSLGLFGN